MFQAKLTSDPASKFYLYSQVVIKVETSTGSSMPKRKSSELKLR